MEHTKEPWACNHQGWCSNTELFENQRRIVACVNACAGYSTENLEEFGRWLSYGEVPAVLEIERKLEEAERQRDELLEALEQSNNHLIGEGIYPRQVAINEAAIKNVSTKPKEQP